MSLISTSVSCLPLAKKPVKILGGRLFEGGCLFQNSHSGMGANSNVGAYSDVGAYSNEYGMHALPSTYFYTLFEETRSWRIFKLHL